MSSKAQMFISYAHSDRPAVKNIYARLLKMPLVRPWMDEKDILPGKDWEAEVRRAIRESQFVLLCLSMNAISHRGVLQKEIKLALDQLGEKLEGDVFLIPTWIQAGPIPSDKMPDSLRKLHWLNLSDTDSWEKLAKTVEEQLRELGLAAPGGFAPRAADGPAPQADFKADEFVAELRHALEASDEAAVSARCEALLAHLRRADHPLPDRDAARILRHLSRNNLLEHSGAVADALLLAGSSAAAVRRVYARVLLERGLLRAPLDILKSLDDEGVGDQTERAEIGGLRGRLYTHIYVAAGSGAGARIRQALADAVNAYTRVYDADPKRHLLHGGRAAALLLRAERDGQQMDGNHTPRALAEAVISELKEREEFGEDVTLSDAAAAVDACLALARPAEALEWLTRLADNEAADALALAEAHRHLLDVWQLTPDAEPGSSMLPFLLQRRAALQRARPAPPSTAAAEAAGGPAPALERVFSYAEPASLAWFKTGLERAHSVACIQGATGQTLGTGFIISARDFLPDGGDELLFLTAAYLLTNDETRETLPFVVVSPEEAAIVFTTSGKKYKVGEILWTSPTRELDATLARLDPPVEGIAPLPVARGLPSLNGPAHVYAIGHPGGGPLAISADDSYLIDYDENFLHYTTPTEPGSGGSPVFDRDWNLVALHHKRSDKMPRLHGQPGTYGAGEGISIQAIVRALRGGGTLTPAADALE